MKFGWPHNVEQVLKHIEQSSEFITLDDGYLYYEPRPNCGVLSSWALRVIADELDRRNAPWDAQVREQVGCTTEGKTASEGK